MFLLLLCFSSENLIDGNTMSWCQMVGCLCVELKVSTYQGQVEAGFCHSLSCSCMFWHCIFPPWRQQFILLLYQRLRSITFGAIFIPTFPLASQVIFGIPLKWHRSMDDNKHRDMNIQRREKWTRSQPTSLLNHKEDGPSYLSSLWTLLPTHPRNALEYRKVKSKYLLNECIK